jgi:hypothetical protein
MEVMGGSADAWPAGRAAGRKTNVLAPIGLQTVWRTNGRTKRGPCEEWMDGPARGRAVQGGAGQSTVRSKGLALPGRRVAKGPSTAARPPDTRPPPTHPATGRLPAALPAQERKTRGRTGFKRPYCLPAAPTTLPCNGLEALVPPGLGSPGRGQPARRVGCAAAWPGDIGKKSGPAARPPANFTNSRPHPPTPLAQGALPTSVSCLARFRAVWPPMVGRMASGRSCGYSSQGGRMGRVTCSVGASLHAWPGRKQRRRIARRAARWPIGGRKAAARPASGAAAAPWPGSARPAQGSWGRCRCGPPCPGPS